MEVTPPQAVWEKLSLNIDEINEDNLVAKRISNFESSPPGTVWETLSLNIDEINEDNRVAQKVLNAQLTPPDSVWEKINSTLNVVEENPFQKKGRVISFRRLAVAALLIGIIATTWILFRNNNDSTSLAGVEKPNQKQTSPNTNTTQENKDPKLIDSPVDPSTLQKLNVINSQEPIASTTSGNNIEVKARNYNNTSRNKNKILLEPTTAQFTSLTEPLGKSFNEPIDDLSSVTSDQNYYTMVNANGRLVKIPAQLASLAPHLQDKPVSEDYYEILFGEGTYWKETLNEWRKKLISAPASGDAFTGFVELLKSVQNK
jgi:hypothetical protein